MGRGRSSTLRTGSSSCASRYDHSTFAARHFLLRHLNRDFILEGAVCLTLYFAWSGTVESPYGDLVPGVSTPGCGLLGRRGVALSAAWRHFVLGRGINGVGYSCCLLHLFFFVCMKHGRGSRRERGYGGVDGPVHSVNWRRTWRSNVNIPQMNKSDSPRAPVDFFSRRCDSESSNPNLVP